MRQSAYIAGVGMTRFGKHVTRGLKSLAIEAIEAAIKDAEIDAKRIQAAWMGTAAASVVTGQVCVPGQIVLRELGINKIPVVNVENACATASTAFQQACTLVTAGLYDVVLAVGFDKLYHEDKARTFSVFQGSVDVEDPAAITAYLERSAKTHGLAFDPQEAGRKKSLFMDIYACMARDYMAESGATPQHFAMVSAKNSYHGSLNPRAQFQEVLTAEEVLDAPMIADPLTLPMCSPIGDGAAAAVIISKKMIKKLGIVDPVRVRSSVLVSGFDVEAEGETVAGYAASLAYETAGIGPSEIDCVELHDASSPAELINYETLQLCPKGEGPRLIEEGATQLGGSIPVNPSGGLNRKGHPIGATGIAQIFELTEQLRGRATGRQVEKAQVALAENGGGFIGADSAAVVVTLLSH
ncbi:MAG: thiolase family protein [Pseudomonadota bacterium]